MKSRYILYAKGNAFRLACVSQVGAVVDLAFTSGTLLEPIAVMVKKYGLRETILMASMGGRQRWHHGFTPDQAQARLTTWESRNRIKLFTVYPS